MIEARRLRNVVIFIQSILSSVLSRKIWSVESSLRFYRREYQNNAVYEKFWF